MAGVQAEAIHALSMPTMLYRRQAKLGKLLGSVTTHKVSKASTRLFSHPGTALEHPPPDRQRRSSGKMAFSVPSEKRGTGNTEI